MMESDDDVPPSDSESNAEFDRFDFSESGIVTEMEHHRRAESMNDALTSLSQQASDDSGVAGGGSKSKKSRRLSSQIARGIKKQLGTGSGGGSSSSKDKDKTKQQSRSLSPARTGSGSGGSQDASQSSVEDDGVVDEGGDEAKKKSKSAYKQVAKAAAKAAKKIDKGAYKAVKKIDKTTKKLTGQKTSSKKDTDSSRSESPNMTEIQMNANPNTPASTPVTATTLIDGHINNLPGLPVPLNEADDRGTSGGAAVGEDEPSIQMEVSTRSEDPHPMLVAESNAVPSTAHHHRVPTDDETVRLAQAMAMAVQDNPTMSHQDIQRMVLGRPEFQHLAPPEGLAAPTSSAGTTTTTSSSSSGGGSKGFTKNFKSLQKKVASASKTASKGFMEYAESTLGGSTTSFPFGMSTKAPPNPSDVLGSVKESTTSSSAAAVAANIAASSQPDATNMTPASSAVPPATISETSISEQSQSTEQSLQNSSASLLAPAAQQQMDPQQPTATEAGNSNIKGAMPSVNESTTFTPPSNKVELPITMTDIVWKRRSGFGSYYRSSAWERRRFVLQGNALSYFRAKGENAGSDDKGTGASDDAMDDRTERFDNDPAFIESTRASVSKSTSTKSKMFDYLEQATTTLGLSASVTATGEKPASEGQSSARGYMDLVKENATVCATLGHSGAPSPFCLSIKVNGETKWKLCFASHRAQLMWLAAITDVIVQNSVDTYNVKLLSAADPANHDPTAAFLPSVYEPPSNAEGQQPSSQTSLMRQQQQQQQEEDLPKPNFQHISGRRLWIMEPYVIKAQSELPPEDGEDSEDEYSDDDEEGASPDTKKPELDATSNDSDLWFMPEKRLFIASILINVAILYARNSTMSVQSFWTLVTVANMTLFAFLESVPRPGVVVTTDSAGALVAKARRKSKRRNRRKGAELGGGVGSADADKPKKKKEKYIPLAGLSAIRLNDHLDPKTNAKGEEFMAWMAVPGEEISVRSHGYMKTSEKVPSPGTLYELVQMDIFESPARYPDMAPRVKLPKLSYEVDPNEVKTWKAPDHFIVSLALPTDPPKLGASSSDGSGYTITMYFNMNKDTRDILKRVTAEGYDPATEPLPEDIQKSQVNAVKLFEEWIRRAPSDVEFQKRFKMLPNVVNAKEVGLPSWIGKYNGKPFLIKRPGQTGFLLPHPELSCVEFDISLHVFPYLAKQGICYMKDTLFKKMLARVGFCIEGRSDDELPECVIGLGTVCYPDPAVCTQASEFFAGTSPRSYEPEDAMAPSPSEPQPAASAPPQPTSSG